VTQEEQGMTKPVLTDHLGQTIPYLILADNLGELHDRKYKPPP
jgi:hypothetical protein